MKLSELTHEYGLTPDEARRSLGKDFWNALDIPTDAEMMAEDVEELRPHLLKIQTHRSEHWYTR